jgi:hypothetical protein
MIRRAGPLWRNARGAAAPAAQVTDTILILDFNLILPGLTACAPCEGGITQIAMFKTDGTFYKGSR